MSSSVEKELRVFLGVAKSIVGLLLCFGVGVSVFSTFCITSLGDYSYLQHLETTKF